MVTGKQFIIIEKSSANIIMQFIHHLC